MKENFCFGCEHVWYDHGGNSTICPNCGHDQIDTTDYQEGYDDGGDNEYPSDWVNDIRGMEQ